MDLDRMENSDRAHSLEEMLPMEMEEARMDS